MWKEVVDNVIDPIAVLDSSGELIYQNRAYAERFNAHPKEYLGELFFDAVMRDLRSGRPFFGVLTVPWRGKIHHLLGYFFRIAGGSYYVFHYSDIEDVVSAQMELAKEHAKYEFLLSNIYGVVGLLDADGKVFYISPSVVKTKGLKVSEVVGREFFEFVHPMDRQLVKKGFEMVLSGEKPHVVVECRQSTSDDVYRYFEVAFSCVFQKSLTGFEGVVFSEQDITHRKMLEHKYYKAVYLDDCTGLPNKRLFEEKLQIALELAKRNGHHVVVVVFDVTGMKRLMDLYGTSAADEILRQIAERLRKLLRSSDIPGRLWSDEFVVALTGITNPCRIDVVVRRVVNGVRGYYVVNGQKIPVDVCAGVSVFPSDAKSVEELLRNAHLAMHYAKESGKDLHFYSPEIEDLFYKKRFLYEELRNAIAARQFALFYQPIVSVSKGRVVGAEALVRWNHPEKGIIFPDDFVPLAEEMGLVHQLDALVLEMALEQLREWRKNGVDVRVAVNVSRREFEREGFLDELMKHLDEIVAGGFELEITETTAFHDVDRARRILEVLRNHGVTVALDDFGTGYSSIETLADLSVDRLKVDKKFVLRMFEDGKNMKIVKTIIQMGKVLDLAVVAEGVETKDHAKVLASLGCDELQGFYFSKAVPADEFVSFYKSFRLYR